MAVEILGREDGRLEQRLAGQLAEAGIHEITWVDPAILEPHGGWREDGAIVWRTEWEMHGQILPIARINTHFYSFKQAMGKYEPKGITWKVWAPSPVVCSKVIAVAIKDDVIQEVLFSGGCDGNSKCIDRLLYGTSVQMAKHLLGDIICGDKRTSCGRELARGL